MSEHATTHGEAVTLSGSLELVPPAHSENSALKMTVHSAFSDTRVYMLRNDAPDVTMPTGDTEIVFHQGECGPGCIQIGRACTDSYLREVWENRKRFPELRLADMASIRDGAVNKIQVR